MQNPLRTFCTNLHGEEGELSKHIHKAGLFLVDFGNVEHGRLMGKGALLLIAQLQVLATGRLVPNTCQVGTIVVTSLMCFLLKHQVDRDHCERFVFFKKMVAGPQEQKKSPRQQIK